ncbi:MAG: iron-containing alcohol dehydrogenase [Verrucomicrobiae bacterium]|nr:iron-containing alcohol dehydrogenase [Verrucomicrobiae bacterium]
MEGSARFETRPSPRLICGCGSIEQLPILVGELGGRRPLIVTDGGIVAAGHPGRAVAAFENAGIPCAIYDAVQENPTESDVAACRDFAVGRGADCLIGLGGGSSMDTAKGCLFLLAEGGAMRDHRGYGRARRPFLPLVAVPTTAGTGSECQSYAVVSRDDTHEKMACGAPQALARIAVLDPELTVSQPPRVAVLTGLDAIAHAVESAVCNRRNPLSSVYSLEAFRYLAGAVGAVIAGEATMEHRLRMQLGAAFSGLAIENSMLGAAHASANPLTARYGVTHGCAVARMLPGVVRFNRRDPGAGTIYDQLAKLLPAGSCDRLEEWLEGLVRAAGLERLAAFGVREEDIAAMAGEASRQWTAKFNPRALQTDDFVELYCEALASS